MGFFSFIVLLAIAYLLWRISDQMPDVLFRLSEIQRDIAELRRRNEPPPAEPEPAAPETEPAAAAEPAATSEPSANDDEE
jgi:hypothetical protein